MARARDVLLGVHTSVDLALEQIDGGVSVGIAPNGEPLARKRPVEGVVLSFRLAREVLFVSSLQQGKGAYQEIRLVEGLELEEILCLHVANVLVNIPSRSSFCRENSHSASRSQQSLSTARKTSDAFKSSLHVLEFASSFWSILWDTEWKRGAHLPSILKRWDSNKHNMLHLRNSRSDIVQDPH